MSAERKYFGTDGIRGPVGEPPITPDFVMKLGWAAGRILAGTGTGPVLIGKDTRISGYMFESALEAGLSAAGVDVCLLGPMPTPAIAFLAQSTHAQAGIVISASHNPFHDNGIKFFSGEGRKLPDAMELAIERELENPLKVIDSRCLGKARRMDDAPRRYIEFCKSRIHPELNLRGLKLVLDCAHGATYRVAPAIFAELGAEVLVLGAEPDGLNINKDAGATHTGNIRQKVLAAGADAGIAFDGDGDRVIMIDHTGTVVDGDEILYIIARAHPALLHGAVVGTVMSNLGLEKAIRALGLGFLRAGVGDRYIMDMLDKHKLVLGGETSGHIVHLGMSTTGDGIISALQVLGAMINSQTSLHDLTQGLHKFPQKLVNIKMQKRVDPHALPGVAAAVREAEARLGQEGRILLRNSGTEPLIRIMVEGTDASQVDDIAHSLAVRIESALVA
jgi:phosphoglucosamine mutase